MGDTYGVFFSRRLKSTSLREWLYFLLSRGRRYTHCGVWVKLDGEVITCSLTMSGIEIVPLRILQEHHNVELRDSEVSLYHLHESNLALQSMGARVTELNCFKKILGLEFNGWLCTDYVQFALDQPVLHLYPDELYHLLCPKETQGLQAGLNVPGV